MQRDVHAALINLENSSDRVPKQEVWNSIRIKGGPEKHILLGVQENKDSHKDFGLRRKNKVSNCTTDKLLTPYLFDMTKDVMTDNIRRAASWNMMLANNVFICKYTMRRKTVH